MKTIGLLGWAPWASTITYYKLLNEMVNERLGGDHNARILLRSIDYHEIKNNYTKDHLVCGCFVRKRIKTIHSAAVRRRLLVLR